MSTATAAAKAPPELQITDHTAIVEFCLRHRSELWDNGSTPRSFADVLTQARIPVKGQPTVPSWSRQIIDTADNGAQPLLLVYCQPPRGLPRTAK